MSAPLTKKDFVSDQEVRWCPGCGDYAILSAIQKAMPELGIARENIVIISGIGCASRFPYYMNTYGFHTIHGRAPAIATGLRLARPDLSVWVITGDGDSLSIGGNHLIHAIRRNININILLFNNEIYGLTKGQYSPTSQQGLVTKSTPFGSIDRPFSALSLALGAEATFVARTYDTDIKGLGEIVHAAAAHKGCSFVEIYQNCVIFNDGVFDNVTGKEVRSEHILPLEHGKPLLFGKNREKGIRIRNFQPEVVDVNATDPAELHVHDTSIPDPGYAFLLSRMQLPAFPVPMGILRAVERPVYEQEVERQNLAVTEKKGPGDLSKLIRSGDLWEIK